jgi:hypothetical protein
MTNFREDAAARRKDDKPFGFLFAHNNGEKGKEKLDFCEIIIN